MSKSNSNITEFLGIFQNTTEEKILRLLVELGIQISGADEGSLLVFNEKKSELEFVMTVGSDNSEKTLKGQCVPLGKGVTGLAAATGEVQIGTPTFKDIKQTDRKESGNNEPETILAAPMLIDDTLIGVLTAVSFQKDKRFSTKDSHIYAGFSTIAALVVDQHRKLKTYKHPENPSLDTAKALGDKGKAEQQIFNSLARLTKNSKNLEHVANLLASIEACIVE